MADQSPDPFNSNDHRLTDLFRILEITRNLAINSDLQSLLKQIENAVTEIFQCERATVFVHDKKTNELFSFVNQRQECVRIAATQGIAGFCFQNGTVCTVEDAYNDTRFNKIIDQKTGFRTSNILACPLYGVQQHCLGVLEVINKASGTFDQWDRILIKTFAAQCGMAIHRQFLTEQTIEKQRIKRDLDLARKIQIGLLPKSPPEAPGFDIFGWSQAAEETGGDFFDFLNLKNGQFLACIADVAGHGIGSAIIAAECSALLRSAFTLAPEIPDSLKHINKLLCENIPENYFITAFVCSLNANTSTLYFISAGHGPVLLFRSQKNQVEHLPIHELPLGIFTDTSYRRQESIHLDSGDILAAFTDGFYEWENPRNLSFGIENIAKTIIENKNLAAKEIIAAVYQALLNHCQHTVQTDDITAVVIKKIK